MFNDKATVIIDVLSYVCITQTKLIRIHPPFDHLTAFFLLINIAYSSLCCVIPMLDFSYAIADGLTYIHRHPVKKLEQDIGG